MPQTVSYRACSQGGTGMHLPNWLFDTKWAKTGVFVRGLDLKGPLFGVLHPLPSKKKKKKILAPGLSVYLLMIYTGAPVFEM